MHIPDGVIHGAVDGGCAAASAIAVGISLRGVRRRAQERLSTVPLMATTAAFVFAAQMLNFPVGGGTSGHFLGAVTVAALLGPWSACLVLALVLAVQCLLFNDGGITALGTNVFNMGVLAGIGGYLVMRGLRAVLPAGRTGYVAAAGVASWVSVVAASGACALELGISGTSPLVVALPAMTGVHAVIGIGEALIAAAVLSAVAAARPDVLPEWARVEGEPPPGSYRRRAWVLAGVGLALALILAAFVSPFASSSPDGFEKIAENKGFAAAEGAEVLPKSLLADYSTPGVKSEGFSTGLAGIVGTALVFAAGFGAIRLVSAGRRNAEASAAARDSR